MAVKSREEVEQPAGDRKGPAVFSRAKLARQQTAFEQLFAWALLIVSFSGSLLAGGGGVAAWSSWAPNWWAAGAALVLQAFATWVQWIYANRSWRSWRYLAAVAASSALTLLGYWPLAHPWMVRRLVALELPAANAPIVAGGLIVLAAVWLDVFPERTLTH